MKLKYDLNLKIYEIGVVLINAKRRKGITIFRKHLEKYESELKAVEYELLKYGIDLIIDGTNPVELEFFIFEEYEKIRSNTEKDYNLHKDLRLIIKFIKLIQKCDQQGHGILLKTLNDTSLTSQYTNWVGINKLYSEITFEKFENMSNKEKIRIIDSNEIIKEYFEEDDPKDVLSQEDVAEILGNTRKSEK